MAPEIFNRSYDERVDMWSLGIVFFILVTGKSPYQGSDNDYILEQVKSAAVLKQLLHETQPKLSKQCLALINRILVKDPRKRISAEQAI